MLNKLTLEQFITYVSEQSDCQFIIDQVLQLKHFPLLRSKSTLKDSLESIIIGFIHYEDQYNNGYKRLFVKYFIEETDPKYLISQLELSRLYKRLLSHLFLRICMDNFIEKYGSSGFQVNFFPQQFFTSAVIADPARKSKIFEVAIIYSTSQHLQITSSIYFDPACYDNEIDNEVPFTDLTIVIKNNLLELSTALEATKGKAIEFKDLLDKHIAYTDVQVHP